MKRSLLTLLLCFLIPNFANSINYEDLEVQQPIHNRMGIGEGVEITKKISSEKEALIKTNTNIQNKEISSYELNYADLSIKRLAIDISSEVEEEQAALLEDLGTLWVAAAQRSETLQYTIYKLSNPDADKPNESMVKKIIKPIASFSTIAGTAFSANPFVASGAIIGGNLLSALSSNSSEEINYQISKVNDADMVLLVRKIDDLQKKLLNLYIDFKTKEKIYKMTLDNLNKREQTYKSMQDATKEELILADVYYRNAQNANSKAKQEYQASKIILEQLVGVEAMSTIEKKTDTEDKTDN